MTIAAKPPPYLEVTWVGDPPPPDKVKDIEQQALEVIREVLGVPGAEGPEIKISGEKTTTYKVTVET
ncbi:hypothetical protein ACWERI_37185 [Streptomyces collinus]